MEFSYLVLLGEKDPTMIIYLLFFGTDNKYFVLDSIFHPDIIRDRACHTVQLLILYYTT